VINLFRLKINHLLQKKIFLASILEDQISIAFLTQNLFWSLRCISSNNFFLAFHTLPLIECSWISERHSFFVPLVGVFSRNWNRVFNVEYEFLFDNLKRFFCYFALYHSCQTIVNIFSGGIKSYHSFVVLGYGKRGIFTSFKYFIVFCKPVPIFYFCFRLCDRKIFLSQTLIISPRCMFDRKKLSPCSFCLHGFNDVFDEFFIFIDRIGGIEDTVMLMIVKSCTSETVLDMATILRVKCL
jgi:hypothetical protein